SVEPASPPTTPPPPARRADGRGAWVAPRRRREALRLRPRDHLLVGERARDAVARARPRPRRPRPRGRLLRARRAVLRAPPRRPRSRRLRRAPVPELGRDRGRGASGR